MGDYQPLGTEVQIILQIWAYNLYLKGFLKECLLTKNYIAELEHYNILQNISDQSYNNIIKMSKGYPLNRKIDQVSSPSSFSSYQIAGGSSNLVKYLAKKADKILFERCVVNISRPEGYKIKWCVTCNDNKQYTFDAVILTIPVPQIITDLKGEIKCLMKEHQDYESLKINKIFIKICNGFYL